MSKIDLTINNKISDSYCLTFFSKMCNSVVRGHWNCGCDSIVAIGADCKSVTGQSGELCLCIVSKVCSIDCITCILNNCVYVFRFSDCTNVRMTF